MTDNNRTEEQERKFRVICGYLAVGNSLYDLISQFVPNDGIDKWYDDIEKIAGENSDDSLPKEAAMKDYEMIGTEVAQDRNEICRG